MISFRTPNMKCNFGLVHFTFFNCGFMLPYTYRKGATRFTCVINATCAGDFVNAVFISCTGVRWRFNSGYYLTEACRPVVCCAYPILGTKPADFFRDPCHIWDLDCRRGLSVLGSWCDRYWVNALLPLDEVMRIIIVYEVRCYLSEFLLHPNFGTIQFFCSGYQ